MYKITDQLDLRDAVIAIVRKEIERLDITASEFSVLMGRNKDYTREIIQSTKVRATTIDQLATIVPLEFRIVKGQDTIICYNFNQVCVEVAKLSKQYRKSKGYGVLEFRDMVGSSYPQFETGSRYNQPLALRLAEHMGIKLYILRGQHDPAQIERPAERPKKVYKLRKVKPGNGLVVNGFSGW